MANLNKVMLIGNLTRDPVMKTTPAGTSVCELGLAVSRKYRTQQGEDKEEVCFVDISFFGKQAENLNRYVRKGDPLFVEGRLRYETWTCRETQKVRSRLTILGEGMQFLSRGNGGQQNHPATASAAPAPGLPPPPAFTMAAPPTPAEQPGMQSEPPGIADEQNPDGFIENLPF